MVTNLSRPYPAGDRREPRGPATRLTTVTRVLAVAVAALITCWQLADALTPSAVLLAAALAVAGLVVALLATRPASPATDASPMRAADLRARARSSSLARLRDPAAAGRPHPRAPAPALPAAFA